MKFARMSIPYTNFTRFRRQPSSKKRYATGLKWVSRASEKSIPILCEQNSIDNFPVGLEDDIWPRWVHCGTIHSHNFVRDCSKCADLSLVSRRFPALLEQSPSSTLVWI